MSINERTTPRRPQREVRRPEFIARAKVGNGWINIGAAWSLKSGDEGFSLKLTSVPLNWDGRFVLVRPLATDEQLPAEE